MVVSETNCQKLVLSLKGNVPSKILSGAALMCVTKNYSLSAAVRGFIP